ncbi:hypothetical protein [Lacrimispora sp.]|uniref:hypothetical protein n=1 Tax=Lacrimispora sp. TaxID=2719234 RepID=UPI0032E3785E
MYYVRLTLKETQVERNNTYKPVLVQEGSKVSFNINQSEESSLINATIEPIVFYNLGGNAIDLEISMDFDNLKDLVKIADLCDENHTYSIEGSEANYFISIDDNKSQFCNWNGIKKPYLLGDGKEAFEYYLPEQYISLLNIAMCSKQYVNHHDYLTLNIQYYDSQGIKYEEKVNLDAQDRIIQYNDNVKGTYTIKRVYE